jgi:hypothetical protein
VTINFSSEKFVTSATGAHPTLLSQGGSKFRVCLHLLAFDLEDIPCISVSFPVSLFTSSMFFFQFGYCVPFPIFEIGYILVFIRPSYSKAQVRPVVIALLAGEANCRLSFVLAG